MKEIRLTDGSLLEVKINFLTLKLISDTDLERLVNIMEKKEKKGKQDTRLQINIAAKMIYVILRSNGRRIDEEEACMLVPMDVKVITELFDEFGKRFESFKKKQKNKIQNVVK